MQHLGKDMVFGENGDFMVSATGDLEVASGGECLLQDVRHRLESGFGDVFSHDDFGSILFHFLGRSDTDLNRALMKHTVLNALDKEKRINPGTVDIVLEKYTAEEIRINISFRSSDNLHPFNMIWKMSINDMEALN